MARRNTMTIEKLREAVHQKPFKPFTILVADGREYRVPSPELISIAPRATRTFVVAHGEEEYTFLDLLLVTGLEFGVAARRRKAS
jgi:hypothetical protein